MIRFYQLLQLNFIEVFALQRERESKNGLKELQTFSDFRLSNFSLPFGFVGDSS